MNALVLLLPLERIQPGSYFRSRDGLVGLCLGRQPRGDDIRVIIAPQRIHRQDQKSFAARKAIWNRHAFVQPLGA